jgi:hypothetical protein
MDGTTDTADSQPRPAGAMRHFRRWFFEGARKSTQSAPPVKEHWFKVMCLTGVDYFSSLGYQPGIAYVAAGLLSPFATIIVVAVTLFGLTPLYFRVAKESPHGQGSIAMLENLLPGWPGKTMILILLGFAATDFVITITLSAADATAHVIQNPVMAPLNLDRIGVTLVLLTILGAVFMKGFREAIGFSMLIVLFYLACNTVVMASAAMNLSVHPELFAGWHTKVFVEHHNYLEMFGISMLLFPKLALGMSGFETGVAVMPLVKGDPTDTHEEPTGRIRNTRKLILAAGMIMAAFLMISSILTTLLIPEAAFKDYGSADGRALAYLAHKFLGEGVGTVYDISTILILWFAGASAMAGLLNLVPRYLPRYGMAPNWARAQRPLVVVFTVITFIVTLLFKADVDSQAGAYATGVLVLFTSAAFATTLVTWREGFGKRVLFSAILLVFIYTSIANMIERPEGLHIASFFIGTILLTSLISRAIRSFELRIEKVQLDDKAQAIIDSAVKEGTICLVAHKPGSITDYDGKEKEIRELHILTEEEASFIFLEIQIADPSEFDDEVLDIAGIEIGGKRILKAKCPAIPNAIAATLLHLRDTTGTIPRAYLGWTEGNPIAYIFKYVFLGEGETAPFTREILREAERDPAKRPKIIVG